MHITLHTLIWQGSNEMEISKPHKAALAYGKRWGSLKAVVIELEVGHAVTVTLTNDELAGKSGSVSRPQTNIASMTNTWGKSFIPHRKFYVHTKGVKAATFEIGRKE